VTDRVTMPLRAAMPWLSAPGLRVLEQLVARHGYPGPAHEFAVCVGMRNRFQLARVLEHEGLPVLEELAGWIRVLLWLGDWEATGTSLSRAALQEVRDPAVCYRTVERVTGLAWSQVRARGFNWVLLTLVHRCLASRSPHQNAGVAS
jgi:hypothetical protein